jgi:hypothetical protein
MIKGQSLFTHSINELANINLAQENTRKNRKGKKEKGTKVITILPGF